MPRIAAPTVAEHHARQRSALLAAAERIVSDAGVEALTLAAVGRAAGLARSSVYQYFDSAPALVAALVEDLMPRSAAHLAEVTDRAGEARDRVEAFVASAIEAAAHPSHRALAALATADLPEECRARLAELHTEQQAPLRAALGDLGVPDAHLTADLLMGVVRAAAEAIASGRPLGQVTQRATALTRAALSE